MLSAQSIGIIKSTVPVLEVHGVAITKRFYGLMFEAHPELLNIFNHANQKQGRQQTALANTVYAAAVHIDNLAAIIPAVKQIAHKHRSLGIKPEHYPIVGKYLLMAIKDVLGEAATDEILAAWAEAYGVIADAFIGVEAEMYEQSHRQAGGWEDFRPFRVQRKVQESSVITSFYLVPEDSREIASYEPGQYVSVKLNIPGENNTHIRQYSLSDAPGKPYYRISVKREGDTDNRPAGIVSTYLHEQVAEGDILHLSAPAGDFVLNTADERPVVLLSGGVGLTPMVSMLNTLAEHYPERAVTFIHAAQDGKMHALRQQVEDVARSSAKISVHYCYELPTERDREAQVYHKEGRIELAWLQSVLGDRNAAYYLCGPVPFMQSVKASLIKWGVPSEDIHYEFFGPKADIEAAGA
ncbi:NO-inducible flavohemoprotein [Paenibacillus sp. 1011MAR3C5]|uniref:NO-inducible flavohemoprotein n=1 Tax=Paenibacillus sp. 1011MAR3C5 TaxID=1675787 RepID=UPI000E6D219C|nr:NO-inducible flavohemoprotein [Paenibacillus sp. 1011MAR3C5]RJE86022.1 NO-inducible flavohemoprotein [Paenibacillus sp. 1011MAR3C5]